MPTPPADPRQAPIDISDPPEAWAPVRRAAQAVAAPVQRFLQIEAASGIVLLTVTAVALVWANIGTSSYRAVWHTSLGFEIGGWNFVRPMHFWINDGLMTVFFLLVGLEIRREIFNGELTSLRKAALPIAAAIGGMLIPAAIFLALNTGRDGAAGWAVPMATDIAFAVGVLTLLGSRVPAAWRVLLLALAVIDDIGAIVVITVFYSGGIELAGVALIGAGIAGIAILQLAGLRRTLFYVVPGALVWTGLLVAGIHPAVAGVVIGLLTPVRTWFGPSRFARTVRSQLALPEHDHEAVLLRGELIDRANREAVSPVDRLIHQLHPWVAFGVMPLFALANAGVLLGDARFSGDPLWLFVGIVGGLAVGKPLGIAITTLAAARSGIGLRSPTLTNSGVVLIGLVAGIGFTMSLFIADLAFPPGPLLDTAKLAILVGSGVAIVVGLGVGLLHRSRVAT